MVGIVVVSHSAKVAEGICDIARQMAAANQRIIPAGGSADGGIGTDAMRICEAIALADDGDGVIVLADLGSAVLSAETACEFLDAELGQRVRIADAPVVEGAVLATVQAAIGASFSDVLAVAEEAREIRKMQNRRRSL
jgi:dihydroxyacetone kinase phosphotransfer subunit